MKKTQKKIEDHIEKFLEDNESEDGKEQFNKVLEKAKQLDKEKED